MKRLAAILILCSQLWMPVSVVAFEPHRYYDRGHRDWHEWTEIERRAYRHWFLEEQREREYRAYIRLREERRREYWRWRHEHSDWR